MKYILINKKNPNAQTVMANDLDELADFADEHFNHIAEFFEHYDVFKLGEKVNCPKVAYVWDGTA